MTVDEALEHADKRLDSDCRTLAAEVRRLRAMLEPTPDARELAEEIQNIKWLIDEGPAHEKLTEAQVRLGAVKEKIVARNNILTNDSYNLTTVLYNHMTRGPWKHIPPEFIEASGRCARELYEVLAAQVKRTCPTCKWYRSGEVIDCLNPTGHHCLPDLGQWEPK